MPAATPPDPTLAESVTNVPSHSQIAVIGGGIAGLWLASQLSRAGYSTRLFEKTALGQGQTLASQGMIHGGIKYTLEGFTTTASETIAAMPSVWEAAIAGHGPVDLSDTRCLSKDYFLFSDSRITSRVTAFFGSKSLRGRIDALDRNDYPAALQHPDFKGLVYRLQDLVLDTGSLLETLARPLRPHLYRSETTLALDAEGRVRTISTDQGPVTADYVILAAGEGTGELLANAGIQQPAMQLRPLQQVMIEGELPELWAHAVSLSAAAKPRVTITTHHTADGRTVWYLGGNLAETGVDRSREAQIRFARTEMKALFPWLNFDAMRFDTFFVNRAEPAQDNHHRPDFPFCHQQQNLIVCWPTKLTLTPMLGNQVSNLISAPPDHRQPEQLSLPPAETGASPWEQAFGADTSAGNVRP
ncbi:MAG: FAD-dependent oxidoreductase [Pseudomonadales bacterium]|nr:FAD-dependent oxidoreductase [Pseudomonadales bacterium]